MAKWAKAYPVTVLCRVLRVTKSAYYDWKQRGAIVVGAEAFMLCSRMKALFAQSRQSLGSRGMVRQLRLAGHVIGRYRVRGLMKRLGLTVKRKRKYRVTTQSQHDLPVAGNVLNRQFNPGQPDQAWVARHYLRLDRAGLADPGSGHGPVCTATRRLVHGQHHDPGAGHSGVDDGDQPAPARSRF